MKKGRKQSSRRHARRRRRTSARGPKVVQVRTHLASPAELEHMRERLRELTETVEALRNGAVDAVVVSGPQGAQVYSLAGAEHPYRIYVEQMQEGAVTVSPDGVILYCNQRFAEMLFLPLERVIGSGIEPYIGANAWRTISAILRGEPRTMKHAAMLHRRQRPLLPATLSASVLHLQDQRLLCLVVTDLTEQNEASQLRLAKEIAEKANVAKDDFLAALSHELRTPLTPALVAAASLEGEADLPPRVRDELAIVRRNVELEARLIDDLLDLTRVARGKLELRLTSVDLHKALDEVITVCRPDIAAKEIDLQLRRGATQERTLADPIRIEQVLWNLLRNAVKFTPRGGVITVTTANSSPDRLTVEVADTGIGFDPAVGTKLFNAFEQGGQHITRQFGGLGLGLAISRSIVEAHRGSLRAHSDGPDRGSTFTLELAVHAVAPVAPPEEAAGPVARPVPAGKRILLVEDHRDTRTVLERALRRHHHEVLAASNARGALEIAAHHQVDVVISDLGLPDLSGLELMRQLRDQFGLQGIAVSGYGMEEDVARSRSAGFTHHLTKPICVEALRELIRKMDAVSPVPVEGEPTR